MKKGNTGSILLISGGAVVADVQPGCVSAKELVDAVLGPFQGKSGGNDAKAQGKAGAMNT